AGAYSDDHPAAGKPRAVLHLFQYFSAATGLPIVADRRVVVGWCQRRGAAALDVSAAGALVQLAAVVWDRPDHYRHTLVAGGHCGRCLVAVAAGAAGPCLQFCRDARRFHALCAAVVSAGAAKPWPGLVRQRWLWVGRGAGSLSERLAVAATGWCWCIYGGRCAGLGRRLGGVVRFAG